METLSAVLLTCAVFGYLSAMLLHAADYAFGESRGWPRTAALAVTWVTAAVHAAAVVTRGLAAQRMPWGNMYEFVLTVTLVGTACWLAVVTIQPGTRKLGLFVMLTQVLLTGFADVVLLPKSSTGPLVPALDSYWFVVHVGTAVLASGLFLVGFAGAVLFLIRAGFDKGKTSWFYPYGRYLPSAESIERLTFRLHAFGFPIWTFAVAAGAIWAEAAWGRPWGWDPKETWAFISWVAYAGYLHARATPSVRRETVAWIAIVAWLTMMMNLFGVNLFFDGLHSYAGVD